MEIAIASFGQEPFQEAYSTSSMGISSYRTKGLLFIHTAAGAYQHSDSGEFICGKIIDEAAHLAWAQNVACYTGKKDCQEYHVSVWVVRTICRTNDTK